MNYIIILQIYNQYFQKLIANIYNNCIAVQINSNHLNIIAHAGSVVHIQHKHSINMIFSARENIDNNHLLLNTSNVSRI